MTTPQPQGNNSQPTSNAQPAFSVPEGYRPIGPSFQTIELSLQNPTLHAFLIGRRVHPQHGPMILFQLIEGYGQIAAGALVALREEPQTVGVGAMHHEVKFADGAWQKSLRILLHLRVEAGNVIVDAYQCDASAEDLATLSVIAGMKP